MPGFRWGSFLGAIGEGVEQGQTIGERYRKMADEQVARRAQQAYENYLLGGPQAGAVPAPTPAPIPAVPGAGGPPMPAPPPGAAPGGAPAPGGGPPVPPLQSVAIPGAKPIAPAQPPPTMAPPPGPGAGAATPPPGGAGPPGANTPAPPPGGGVGAGLPPPGSPQTQDPIVQSKAAIQAIAKEIAAANPGRKWHPGELLDAVGDALGQMDKVDPIAKQIAQLQLQYYKANLGASEKDASLAERTRYDRAREAQLAGVLAERIRHERATESTAQSRASTYAEMATYSHEDRQAAIQAANERASQAVDSREKIAAQKDADTMERLDKALEDKDWATVAQIQAGEYKAETAAAQPGSAPRPRPAVAPPPRRTAGATAGTAPPVAGARKAPDGKWYVPDPKRPGKYLMVTSGAP